MIQYSIYVAPLTMLLTPHDNWSGLGNQNKQSDSNQTILTHINNIIFEIE